MRKEFECMVTSKARDVLNDDTVKVDFSLVGNDYKDGLLQGDWVIFQYACEWQLKVDVAICEKVTRIDHETKVEGEPLNMLANGCANSISIQYLVMGYDSRAKTATLVDNE